MEMKDFSTSYLSMKIPINWTCRQIQYSWYCWEGSQQKKKVFLVIKSQLKAKNENIETFFDYLSHPISYRNNKGFVKLSEVKHFESLAINNSTWGFAIHQGGQLEGYTSYYYATIQGDLSILVTFNVLSSEYNLTKELFKIISQSFQVRKTLTTSPHKTLQKQSSEVLKKDLLDELSANDYQVIPDPNINTNESNSLDSKIKNLSTKFSQNPALLVIIIFVGAFAFYRLKQILKK